MKLTIKQWNIVLDAVNLLKQQEYKFLKENGVDIEGKGPSARRLHDIATVLEILNFEKVE